MKIFSTLLFVTWGHFLSIYAKKCPEGMEYSTCGPYCPMKCWDIKSLLNQNACIKLCSHGCFCIKDNQVQKRDSNLNIKCVDSREDCCTGGMVWDDCGNACTKTCKHPKRACKAKCFPHCVCPDDKPIWHNGKCITKHQCICPHKKQKHRCDQCVKCKCTKKKSSCPLIKKPCFDVDNSKQDQFFKFAERGCWRKAPNSRDCIFYNQCINALPQPNCTSNPKGFCRNCFECTCDNNGQEQCMEKFIHCGLSLYVIRKRGCWALVKGHCRWVHPCPVPPNEKDIGQCSQEGELTCRNCKTCQCINGVQICRGVLPCGDPLKSGCNVLRPQGCTFVSPCPREEPKCGMKINPLKDFCYAVSEDTKKCEFTAPCPSKCTPGETVCKGCNECTCTKKGKIRCSKSRCGNPLDKGCWRRVNYRCRYESPCPIGAREQCKGDDISDLSVKNGCWSPVNGVCKFFYPCNHI